MGAIRELELAVVEGDLVGWQLQYGWSEICRLIGGSDGDGSLPFQPHSDSEPLGCNPVPPQTTTDLRFLTLRIHGSLSRFAADILHPDADWITHDLSRLTSLRRLEIEVEDAEVGKEALRVLEKGLRERVEGFGMRRGWGRGRGRGKVEVVVRGCGEREEGLDKLG